MKGNRENLLVTERIYSTDFSEIFLEELFYSNYTLLHLFLPHSEFSFPHLIAKCPEIQLVHIKELKKALI